jgi:hypothetical protein
MNKVAMGILAKLYETGSKYEGNSDIQGLKEGKGKCTYVDGSLYDGDWVSGKRHGEGQYTFSNGTIYKGQWADDMMNGLGELYLTNGEVIKTTW